MTNIYVDASFSHQTKKAAIGIPHKGISICIKARGSLAAEIIAVIRGVYHAKHNDVVLSDCKPVVIAIRRKRTLLNHEKLMENLNNLIKKKKTVVKWVSRKQNRKADKLAQKARKNSEELCEQR